MAVHAKGGQMHSHKLNYDDPISVFSPLLQFYFKSFIPACVLQKSGVEPRLLVILSLNLSFRILFMSVLKHWNGF